MSATLIGPQTGIAPPVDFFDYVSADQFTKSDDWTRLVARSVTCPQILRIRIFAAWSFTIGKDSTLAVGIFINGILQTAAGGGHAGAQEDIHSGALQWGDAADVPGQLVELKWRCVGGQGDGIWCRPATAPDLESCSLSSLWVP